MLKKLNIIALLCLLFRKVLKSNISLANNPIPKFDKKGHVYSLQGKQLVLQLPSVLRWWHLLTTLKQQPSSFGTGYLFVKKLLCLCERHLSFEKLQNPVFWKHGI